MDRPPAAAPRSKPPSPRYRSMLRDGWWIGLLALLIITAGTIWQVAHSLAKPKLQGDMVNPESYGFDLSNLTVPRESLGAYARRDEVPVLTDPEFIDVAEVERIAREEHGKYLVPTDRVIGVEWEGQARAFPLKLMAVHEAVNMPTLSDPREYVAVLYFGFADMAQVVLPWFETTLRSSGLTHNGVALYADVPSPHYDNNGGSLWSPLFQTRIAGPDDRFPRYAGQYGKDAREEEIGQFIPCQVMQWRDWVALHPETQVVAPLPGYHDSYRRNHFGSYFQTNEIPFPVLHLPQEDNLAAYDLDLKSRVLGLKVNGRMWAVAYDAVLQKGVAETPGEPLLWTTEIGGEQFTFAGRLPDVGFAPETVWLHEGPADTIRAACCLWFAWYAHFPGTGIVSVSGVREPAD